MLRVGLPAGFRKDDMESVIHIPLTVAFATTITGQEVERPRNGSAASCPRQGNGPDQARSRITTTFGGVHALDNLCSADDSVATGNGFVIHAGRLYPHFADIGACNGFDTHHPGTKSNLAGAVKRMFSFQEVLC